MLNLIPTGRTMAFVSLVSVACSGEISRPAPVPLEPEPETPALVSCGAPGGSPAACETPSTSPCDANDPFQTPASPSGRIARFHIDGMTCEGCAWQIREALRGVRGVARAYTRLAVREAFVDYDPTVVDVKTIAKALEAAAYPAVVLEQSGEQNLAEPGELGGG